MFNLNILAAMMVAFIPLITRAAPPELNASSGNFSRQGVVKLEWTATDENPEHLFELQQATDASFETAQRVYQGSDAGTFISGLENGIYYYRVRTAESPWSETIRLDVEHHSLTLAIFLMIIGAGVFLITLIMILRASKKQQSI